MMAGSDSASFFPYRAHDTHHPDLPPTSSLDPSLQHSYHSSSPTDNRFHQPLLNHHFSDPRVPFASALHTGALQDNDPSQPVEFVHPDSTVRRPALAPSHHTSNSSIGNNMSGSSNSVAGNSHAQNGKRISKSQDAETSASARKRQKQDANDDSDDVDETETAVPTKIKATRGSRACTVCRRLKMKCIGAENGPPCKRCVSGNHECIFEESNRGKRSSKKHEVLTKTIKKMEMTLETVMRSLVASGNTPGLNAAALSHHDRRSPSPLGDVGEVSVGLTPRSETENGMVPESPAFTQRSSSSHQYGLAKQTESLTNNSLVMNSPLSPAPLPSPQVSLLRGEKESTGSPSSASRRRPPSPQLHSLPDNVLNPLGLLAEASLANRRETRKGAMEPLITPDMLNVNLGADANEEDVAEGSGKSAERRVGVANETYFKPGPINILPLRRLFIERQIQPEMLSFVSNEEVIDLFNIYFDRMNFHCSLLDREVHTPSLVCSRSPFLLTAICAISSKFYAARPEIHPRLTQIAKKLAFSVPERGFKSLEIVQAYLLLSLWGCGPVERFEQDKTWLLLGLAIRVGTDLNLHRKSTALPPEAPKADRRAREKEMRNRERTWLVCYVLDRSFSAQMGKPHSIMEDFIIRGAKTWWQFPGCPPTDTGLAGYVELQRIMSRSLDFLYSGTSTVSGLHDDCDYLLVIRSMESQLVAWKDSWQESMARYGDNDLGQQDVSEYMKAYPPIMSEFYWNYAMLVLNSFGLQNALEHSTVDLGHFFARCHSSAMKVALIVRDKLGPLGYLRYTTDSHFVLASYAVLTLLRFIRPEFSAFMGSEEDTLSIVSDIADTLDKAAANPTHTPALYSTFLRALISAKRAGPSAPSSPSRGESGQEITNGNGYHQGKDDADVSPIDLANGPAAGVFGDEQQFGDGALGLKMFPGEMGGSSNHEAWPTLNGDSGLQFQANGQHGMGDFMSMDSIFNGGFWDNVLLPGYSSGLEGLSAGFVYGPGGRSGFITPRRIGSPDPTGDDPALAPPISQTSINNAFNSQTSPAQ